MAETTGRPLDRLRAAMSPSQARRQVVITGMGAVSCLGVGVEPFWRGLLAREYGIRPITRFDTAEHKSRLAGEVRGLQLQGTADPAVQFLVAAACEAVGQARLASGSFEPSAAAVVLGTNFGAMDSGARFLAAPDAPDAPRWLRAFRFNQLAELLGEMLGFAGLRCVVSLSCSSGNSALGRGAEMIRSGEAEVVLTGGFDSISELSWAGLTALRTMTADKVRPFDRRRDGTIFSEGAGVIVIESADSALRRGAPILAEFLGWWANNNAYHMAHPDKSGESIAAAMRLALDDTGLPPEAVDHINAHGTGTRYNDSTETMAIKSVFGPRAYDVPVNSIKSMIGHVLGASSTLEAICSVMTIREGVIPATINLEQPDPECDLDYVADGPRQKEVSVVLSNSSGIGGPNCAVVLGKWPTRQSRGDPAQRAGPQRGGA